MAISRILALSIKYPAIILVAHDFDFAPNFPEAGIFSPEFYNFG